MWSSVIIIIKVNVGAKMIIVAQTNKDIQYSQNMNDGHPT